MNEELVYEYVKGQGWVPGPLYRELSEIVGIYRLTVQARRPVGNETGFAETSDTPLEESFNNIKTGWHFDRPGLQIGSTISDMARWHGRLIEEEDRNFITVILEQL